MTLAAQQVYENPRSTLERILDSAFSRYTNELVQPSKECLQFRLPPEICTKSADTS